MKLPRQVTPQRRSQAPYNFVPLPDKVYEPAEPLPDHSRFEPDRYSGFVEVGLKTETWLYTRAAVTPDYAQRHPEMNDDVWRRGSEYSEFFHHGDNEEPVIPGSSLRGMLRQLVEVLSDSGLTTASDRPIVYRAVGDPTRFGWTYRRRFIGPNLEPGEAADSIELPQKVEYPVRAPHPNDPLKQYSVHGGHLFRQGRQWRIQPAQRWPQGSEESFVRVDASQIPAELRRPGVHAVWVVPDLRKDHPRKKVVWGRSEKLTLVYSQAQSSAHSRRPDSTPPPSGAVPAQLVITAGLTGKHLHCAIFEPDTDVESLEVSAELQQIYLRDAKLQRAEDREGRILARSWNEPKEGEQIPCFYMLDSQNRVVFLGGTLFFRLPYRRTPKDFVPAVSSDDLARRLFGGLMPAGPRKGRLRFEDLLWLRNEGESPFVAPGPQGYRSPPHLLEPKPACIQHYLVQPQGVVPADDKYKKELRHYDDPPFNPESVEEDGATVLRGFKHYWHRKGEAAAACQGPASVPENERTTRTVLRPVRDGVRFAGRIRFDNLSLEELGALLVALQLKPSMRHKLGMGRPLGFGSVEITHQGLRLLALADRYESFFSTDRDERDSAAPVLKAGWKSAAEAAEIAGKAILAFARRMIEHRGGNLPEDSSTEDALDRFWASPRMRELAALLEWVGAPPSGETAQRTVPHDQWRSRMILPPPHAVIGWTNPWLNAAEAPRGTKEDVRNGSVSVAPGPATEHWPDASITFDKGGGGTLRAVSGSRRAEARQQEAGALLGTLSEESRARLGKGRGITAKVVVDRMGVSWRLLEVREKKG